MTSSASAGREERGTPEQVAITPADVRRCLFAPRRDDDKYRRGVVGLCTGSSEYPGAARLGAEAAARSGAGMVRYLGPEDVGAMVLRDRPEIVLGEGRVDAVVAGSGTSDLFEASAKGRARFVLDALTGGTPAVLDAGALGIVGRRGGQGSHRPPLESAVITPHARELARLAPRVLELGGGLGDLDEADLSERVAADPVRWAVAVARESGATVVLKGATTVIAAADGSTCLRVGAPTSVLATAGTGDVLAGAMGALFAVAAKRAPHERPPLAHLAAAAVWVHGRAAMLASLRTVRPGAAAELVIGAEADPRSSAPVTAMSVAAAVPAVIGAMLDIGAE
ncbi:hypothetical protein GCM10011490_06470 [Pseudoclavibacter endophyticus]|uniref:ADP-dependent (S)-NAD(P)H-hydrate dehydratase n=1 Tax=Pseudoclavibacter endophyticus TaxID=1778590 RepID=A0A6H9WL67_9MICO|nr:ADP/ATP-dependent (S)-NAD(P)H-hydrate dehydratase [Pseudoclavibacter endophyticus]KAB1649863.1 NAD(P)H-hydrate dehydratase [Pseudoclavibacter endophyticus]GGA59188.1 hypothetical protein GCM10011490_06470 [Pseudoclavibacter endophyticus]